MFLYQFPAGTEGSDGPTRGNGLSVATQWPRIHLRRYRRMRRAGISAGEARAILWDAFFDAYLRDVEFVSWDKLRPVPDPGVLV